MYPLFRLYILTFSQSDNSYFKAFIQDKDTLMEDAPQSLAKS